MTMKIIMNKFKCWITGGHTLHPTIFFPSYDHENDAIIFTQRCSKCGKLVNITIPADMIRVLPERWRCEINKEGKEMLKIGDKVQMNDKYRVSAEKRNKVWTVRSEPWMCCGTMVVKLEGMAGGYAVDGLDVVMEE